MIKYRRLSNEELEGLKDEFIKFLVVQGIDASTWLRLKDGESGKADGIIDQFSNFIWEGILEKVKYLEQIEIEGIRLYKIDEDEIFLIGITPIEGFSIDFKNGNALIEMLKLYPENFQILRAKKKYSPDKYLEIFKLIDQDKAYVSKGEWYESLAI